MLKAIRSLPVALKSIRPMYCLWLLSLGVTRPFKKTTSAIPSRLLAPPDPFPPVPGDELPVYPGSLVPRAEVRGRPRSRPWPGMVAQFVPSIRPTLAQLLSTCAPPLGPTLGKLRNAAAFVPEAARPRKADV